MGLKNSSFFQIGSTAIGKMLKVNNTLEQLILSILQKDNKK